MKLETITVTLLASMLAATPAHSKPTAVEKCEASKNLAAGKYALCREKAESTLVLNHDSARYSEAVAVCKTNLNTAWQKAEQQAARKGVTCADAPFPVAQFALAIDGLAAHVAAALGGAGSPAVCNNGCSGKADGTTCDAGFDFGNTLICVGGSCQACVPDGNGVAARFVDNGDGTITDLHTCLVWEKKDDAGGIHDIDNTYSWSIRGNPQGDCAVVGCPPNGDVFTVFLGGLNGGRFGGHGDWRLATSAGNAQYPTGQAPEIESLIHGGYPDCANGSGGQGFVPCVDPIFNVSCGEFNPNGTTGTRNDGCTVDGTGGTEECSCALNNYSWSYSDSYSDGAWTLWEALGATSPGIRKAAIDLVHARAVRGGVIFIP